MKYWKLLAICMLPLSFVACSEDDNAPTNTGNATVEFKSATMQVKENTTIVELPIVVSGEHNGDIKVTAKMVSSSENYEQDKDVIVTTEKFVLPAETESVNLEAHLVGLANDAIEPGRSITFEITEVVGASMGSNKVCTVELKENNPLEGTYVFKGYDIFSGSFATYKCTLSMEEGVTDKAYIDFGYGELLQLNMEEVEPVKKYNITIPAGQTIGTYGSYGAVSFVKILVNWNTGSIGYGNVDINGTYDNGVISLDLPEDYGVGIRVSAGFLEAYITTVDDEGVLHPITFTKQ